MATPRTDEPRKQWLLGTFGDGQEAPCAHCGSMLTYDEIEADRIVPGHQGGTYCRSNLQPSCGPCNKIRYTLELA